MKKPRRERIGRRNPTRNPKVQFTLFCEGKKTEPHYFKALLNHYNGSLIQFGEVGRAPITLAEEAVKFVKSTRAAKGGRGRRNHFEEHDEVWVVFDRDEHERFDEAVSLCEANRIGVARSNPCFEVWLILHMEDYGRQDNSHRVKDEFRRLCSKHYQGLAMNVMLDKLTTRIEEAEERGEKLNQQRRAEGQPHGRPSTTVGELARAIRSASNRVKGT